MGDFSTKKEQTQGPQPLVAVTSSQDKYNDDHAKIY